MTKEIIVSADTVDLALEKACNELGKQLSEIKYDILTEPKKSLFGKIKSQAEIKVYFEEEQTKLAIAQKFINDVLESMGITGVEQVVTETEDAVTITLVGENLGIVIGHRGETLDSFQYLTSLVANKEGGDYFRVIIDSGNFREKREETLKGLANKIARTVLKTGRSSTLEAMNPYERRIIHAVIGTIDGVYSKSIGEEPNRRVVIASERSNKKVNFRPNTNRKREDRDRKPHNRDNNGEYVIKSTSNKPSTYDFEKQFLKSEGKQLYSKIDFDAVDNTDNND